MLTIQNYKILIKLSFKTSKFGSFFDALFFMYLKSIHLYSICMIYINIYILHVATFLKSLFGKRIT